MTSSTLPCKHARLGGSSETGVTELPELSSEASRRQHTQITHQGHGAHLSSHSCNRKLAFGARHCYDKSGTLEVGGLFIEPVPVETPQWFSPSSLFLPAPLITFPSQRKF